MSTRQICQRPYRQISAADVVRLAGQKDEANRLPKASTDAKILVVKSPRQ